MILNFDNLVQWVMNRCDSFNSWQRRKRIFDTKLVLFHLLNLISGLNYSSHYSSLMRAFIGDYFPVTAASSFHAARYKVGWVVFKKIFIEMIQLIDRHFGDTYCWRGHRLFAIDGSKITLPAALRHAKYPRASKEALYPMGLLSTLYRLKLNLPYDWVFSRHTNEIKNASKLIHKLLPSDIVIYDRYFISGTLLHKHWDKGIQFVFRCKTKGSYGEITDFANSKEKEAIVTFKRLDSIAQVRLVKYRIAGHVYILATSLLDREKYPIYALKALYHKRWGIEEFYKTLKRSQIIEQFHAKKPAGIKQEIVAAMIHHVLSRFLILKAPSRQRRRESQAKVKAALCVVSELINPIFLAKSPIVQKRNLDRALLFLARDSTPFRPNRRFPRISRKPSDHWQYKRNPNRGHKKQKPRALSP